MWQAYPSKERGRQREREIDRERRERERDAKAMNHQANLVRLFISVSFSDLLELVASSKRSNRE